MDRIQDTAAAIALVMSRPGDLYNIYEVGTTEEYEGEAWPPGHVFIVRDAEMTEAITAYLKAAYNGLLDEWAFALAEDAEGFDA